MKINELINYLKLAEKKYGNIEVMVTNSEKILGEIICVAIKDVVFDIDGEDEGIVLEIYGEMENKND